MALPRSLWRDARATAVGAAAGLAAFVVGFAATFALQYDELSESSVLVEDIAALLGPRLADLLGGVADWLEPDALEVVGWFFYASHYVGLEVTASALGQSLERSIDLQQTAIWDAELAIVPPLVLFATGFLLAHVERDRARSPLATGLRVALGYGTVAVLVAIAVTYTRDIGVAAVVLGPDVATAGAFCAAYALVFGGGGALLHAEFGPTATNSDPNRGQDRTQERDR